MRFFEGQNVAALISDRSVDFTPVDFNSPLSEAQRDYLKQESGLDIPRVYWRKQIHGDDVIVAEGSACGAPDADAYITAQKNLPIAIRTADCVPVFLYDAVKSVIGLAHAGWKGTHKQIAYKTVKLMQEKYGCNPKDIQAVLGPSIGACCYEVGGEFRGYFPDDVIVKNGKLHVDVAQNNYRQLVKAGLTHEHITKSAVCTFCDTNYFSFRREAAAAGRMISLMVLL